MLADLSCRKKRDWMLVNTLRSWMTLSDGLDKQSPEKWSQQAIQAETGLHAEACHVEYGRSPGLQAESLAVEPPQSFRTLNLF